MLDFKYRPVAIRIYVENVIMLVYYLGKRSALLTVVGVEFHVHGTKVKLSNHLHTGLEILRRFNLLK